MKLALTAKAETKKAIFHDLGCDADDWLDRAKAQAHEFRGAKSALVQATKNVQAMAEAVTADLDAGKFASMEPLEIAAYAKLWITRAVESLENHARNMANCEISMAGEIAAYEKLVKRFKDLHDKEDAVITRIEEALASGEMQIESDGSASQSDTLSTGRLPGVRPAPGIAAQRKAEAAAQPKAAASKPNGKAKKTFKCGNCGKPGHTARGCPDKKTKAQKGG